jgi:DNA-binding transcriptional ArsR family regulator
MKRTNPGAGLGPTQRIVLMLLGASAKSVETMERDGFGLTASSIRSTIDRLADRGLVDAVRFDDSNHRMFGLTALGREVEAGMMREDDWR